MNIHEPFRAAFGSLKANKLRSALTTLGIVIGVSAVIAVVSLIQGFNGVFVDMMEKFGSNSLSVFPARSWDMPSEEYKKIKSRDMTMYDMHALAMALPQVIISVTPFIDGVGGEVRHKGITANTGIRMTDETWLEQNKFNLDMGRNFVPADMRLKSKVTIIGSSLIEKMGIKGNPVGQIISFHNMDFEIVGVLEDMGGNLLFDPNDAMVIPITTGMATLPDDRRRQLSFTARYKPHLDAEQVEDIVRDTLRRIRGVKSNEVEGFRVTSMKREAAAFNTVTAAITGIASGMVSIALIVGGIGIMNIMLVSVTERTREIGVRKAVGAKRGDIKTQFLIEATVLCLLGGALGILLGFVAGTAASKIIFNQIRVIPVWAFIAGFGVPAAIGIFFGYYPAAKASKLDPIESLRHE